VFLFGNEDFLPHNDLLCLFIRPSLAETALICPQNSPQEIISNVVYVNLVQKYKFDCYDFVDILNQNGKKIVKL